jgi:ParB family chromosome partitioning protein
MIPTAQRENKLRLDEIKVGNRCRQNLGNIDDLAASIQELGLLQPIVVNGDHQLVAGARRLAAVRELGWETVPVRVAEGLDDALKLLLAERDENLCRKDFSPFEMVEMKKRLDKLAKAEARKRQRAGGKHGGKTAGRGRGKQGAKASGNFPEAYPEQSNGRAREQVAAVLGISDRSLEKAEAILNAATREPEKYADLVEQVEKSGKIDPAYKALRERQQPPPEPAAPPRFPHSDQLFHWLKKVTDESNRIQLTQGGLGALLAEPERWNWEQVRACILPMMEGVHSTLGNFVEELRRHAEAAEHE